MKTDKLLLIMQVLNAIAATLFLVIYSDYNTYILSAISILYMLVAINIYKYFNKIDLAHYSLWAQSVLAFLIYSLYGLGSMQAPQSFEKVNTKNNIIFNFHAAKKIDKICYFVGIDDNARFTLEEKTNTGWKGFYKYEENFPFSFRWRCIEQELNTTMIRLRITQNSMMLNEVKFLYKNSPIQYTSKNIKLNDEQFIKIDTTYYGGMFFDEIYHGRTAYEIIHNRQIYETTHPFLGKVLLSHGIKFFGMTPFGWRISNLLFASFFIFLIYYFSLIMFKSTFTSFVSSMTVVYSFMHFTQARAAAIDTFGVLFILASYYFLYKFIINQKLSWLITSGIFFGLAASIKWSALFASFGFFSIAIYLIISSYPLKQQFKGYRLLLYGALSHIIIATLVYALTFYDLYFNTGSIQAIIDYQVNMYDYHTRLVATHPYSSPWWSWMIDMKPMNYYRDIKDGVFSSITCFGNPAIFWTGIAVVPYILYVSIIKRKINAIFLLIAFLSLYLPYIFVSRLMFIYHFYYSVPFLIIMIAYVINDLLRHKPKDYILLFIYISMVIMLFFMFYPILSGYEISKSFVDNYLVWFEGWWL